MVILAARAFDAATPTRVNPYERNALAAAADDVAERAKAATEKVPDFDEAAAIEKPFSSLFLCGSPLKPSGYVVPIHALPAFGVRRDASGLIWAPRIIVTDTIAP